MNSDDISPGHICLQTKRELEGQGMNLSKNTKLGVIGLIIMTSAIAAGVQHGTLRRFGKTRVILTKL